MMKDGFGGRLKNYPALASSPRLRKDKDGQGSDKVFFECGRYF